MMMIESKTRLGEGKEYFGLVMDRLNSGDSGMACALRHTVDLPRQSGDSDWPSISVGANLSRPRVSTYAASTSSWKTFPSKVVHSHLRNLNGRAKEMTSNAGWIPTLKQFAVLVYPTCDFLQRHYLKT